MKKEKKSIENDRTPNQTENSQEKKASKREILRKVLFWISLCVFIVAIVKLGHIGYTYWSNNRGYKDLRDQAQLSSQDEPKTRSAVPTEETETVSTKPIVEVIIDPSGISHEVRTLEPVTEEVTVETTTVRQREDILPPDSNGVDHEFLNTMNSNYVGYIVIPGTEVDYPVVQGSDNVHYLRYDYYERESISGCPFLDYRQAPDFSEFNSTICAHNQKDNKMFGTLNRYASKEFWETNPYVYIMTPNGNYRYKVFSVYQQYYVDMIFGAHFPTDTIRREFLDLAAQRSLYKTDVEVSVEDHILTLYTCTDNSDIRFVVHAVCENY